jgi:molybdopterin converting factor small subunit
MPTVAIPPPYRGPTQGVEALTVSGATVLECLQAVEARFPGFLPQILDAGGHIHRFVRLFRNGDQLEGDALGEPLEEGDRIEILAAIAGG